MSGFKLNFESQFDILYAIFCFNFSLYWCCSWHTKKKKGNDLSKGRWSPSALVGNSPRSK